MAGVAEIWDQDLPMRRKARRQGRPPRCPKVTMSLWLKSLNKVGPAFVSQR
jgi:hypothetical protein